MKKFILPFCFAIFLSAGLVSCSDDAAEVAPFSQDSKLDSETYGTGDRGSTTKIPRP